MEKQKPKKTGKFDLKNLSHEEKVKYIGMGVIAVVFCCIIGYGYYSNNDNPNANEVEEMTNPEADLSKYNSKLEAINKKKDPNLANDLEVTFAETPQEPQEEVDFTELDRQIANLGKSETPQNPVPQSTNSSGGNNNRNGGGQPSNTHNVYGNYDMWQTNEPPNSRIEYTNKSNRPIPKKPTPQPKTERVEYIEPMLSQVPVRTNYAQQVSVEPKQVRAKLISQGYATTGRTLSFILLEPSTIAGQEVKKGQVVTGVAQEQDNRLMVNFSSVKIDNKIYSVTMELMGSDGMKGLPVSQGEQSESEIENEVRNQAGQIGSRVPIVGGILNSATRKTNRNKSQPIKLTSNIKCYILIY